jgi:hypothetical protein
VSFHLPFWILGRTAAPLIMALTLTSGMALAQTFDVKQLEVKQGNLEAGLDNTAHGGVPRDRGSEVNHSAHDQSLDYGMRDWWRLSGVLKLENPQDAEFRVAKVAVENIFVLKAIDNERRNDIGLGWFAAFEAAVHQDTTNSFIFGPIMTVKAGKLAWTANPFLEKTIGQNRVEGIALNYAWQAKYEVVSGLAVGVEGFGLVENLGNTPPWSQQEHRIGPVIFTEIALTKDFKVSPDIGLLFGLTASTPDVAVKLNIGVPLPPR